MATFNYRWSLNDYPEKCNIKVFSCFACGGGSSMGYKLNGFDVIGVNEIDKEMMDIYIKNHNPKLIYLQPIQEFKNREDLPKELYELDILDGSPPCSTFSMAGQREENWGKNKVFREGQAKQVLSDLFFDFIDLTEKLKPKVIIAENVKGLIMGNARGYLKEIIKRLNNIGYNTQVFLLNAATMGVPQKRERIFIIGRRKDLNFNQLKLKFNEKPILFKEISDDEIKYGKISNLFTNYWNITKPGQSVGLYKTIKRLNSYDVSPTIVAGSKHFHPDYPRNLTDKEIITISTFPKDYNFLNTKVNYVCGMSVPPVMIAKIAEQIKLQWFNNG